jgi:hypothetical protein
MRDLAVTGGEQQGSSETLSGAVHWILGPHFADGFAGAIKEWGQAALHQASESVGVA